MWVSSFTAAFIEMFDLLLVVLLFFFFLIIPQKAEHDAEDEKNPNRSKAGKQFLSKRLVTIIKKQFTSFKSSGNKSSDRKGLLVSQHKKITILNNLHPRCNTIIS